MRIALVLKQKKDDGVDEHLDQVVIFNLEKDKVVGVENHKVETDNLASLTRMALTEQVKEIFIPDADEEIKPYFVRQGITMKGYDELGDNKLFQTFIV